MGCCLVVLGVALQQTGKTRDQLAWIGMMGVRAVDEGEWNGLAWLEWKMTMEGWEGCGAMS